MRGLIIKSPWIERILDGQKTWEIRSKATNIRGRIALIRGGSGLVWGTADLVGCLGPFSAAQLAEKMDKHRVPPAVLSEFVAKYHGAAYAWELTDARKLQTPVPYQHPSGAVIWVTLPEEMEARFQK